MLSLLPAAPKTKKMTNQRPLIAQFLVFRELLHVSLWLYALPLQHSQAGATGLGSQWHADIKIRIPSDPGLAEYR